jgi:hypothetical protein
LSGTTSKQIGGLFLLLSSLPLMPLIGEPNRDSVGREKYGFRVKTNIKEQSPEEGVWS